MEKSRECDESRPLKLITMLAGEAKLRYIAECI